MDVSPPSPLLPNKNKCLSKFIDKYPKFFGFVKKYKLPIVLTVGIILISTLVYFIAVSNKTNFPEESGQNKEKKIIDGNLLKVGDYVQFGSYEVEKEGYSPLLWVIIDNNHYKGNIDPAIGHLTLLTADIIDLRGFDAIEPKNSNELRRGYGNSRYRTSNIRQWLNSDKDENKWWTPQNLNDGILGTNNADVPPSDNGFLQYNKLGYADKKGFLKSFTADEIKAILDTTLDVGKNTVTEGGGKETVADKIFLLSLTEAGYTGVGGAKEGKVFNFFKNDLSRQVTLTKQCVNNSLSKDKLSTNQNWDWWLRSPSIGFPASVFLVSKTGAVLNSPTSMSEGSIGIRPALNIRSDAYFLGSGTENDPYIMKPDTIGTATGISSSEDATDEEDIDQKAQVTVKDEVILSSDDKLLKTLCQNAIKDYPLWSQSSSSMIAWQDVAGTDTLSMRWSPDYPTVGVQSPVKNSETLAGIDFIDSNKLGYVSEYNHKWSVGLMSFEISNGAFSNKGTSTLYTKTTPSSVLDVTFISQKDFIVFYLKENNRKAVISYVKSGDGTEETLKELDISPPFLLEASNQTQKVSASPKGNYVYALFTNLAAGKHIMYVFDLSKKVLLDEISASSAVWIGDSNILYSSKDKGGIFLYSLKDKSSHKISLIDDNAENLAFCPKSGGVFAYSTNSKGYDSKAHTKSCNDWTDIFSEDHMFVEAIADEGTAISSKYALDNTFEDGRFWRFDKKGWGFHLSYGFSSFNSNTVLSTVWNKY